MVRVCCCMKLHGLTCRFSGKRSVGIRRRGTVRRGALILVLSGFSAHAGLSKLEAISMIESGNNDFAVGGAGEISRYQIKPYIWGRYSRSQAYRNVEVSKSVAEKYLEALEVTFRKRAGREPTNFDRYVLWNGGPAYYARIGFSPSRVHRIIRDRAKRFANLCEMNSPDGKTIATAATPVTLPVPPPGPPALLPNSAPQKLSP